MTSKKDIYSAGIYILNAMYLWDAISDDITPYKMTAQRIALSAVSTEHIAWSEEELSRIESAIANLNVQRGALVAARYILSAVLCYASEDFNDARDVYSLVTKAKNSVDRTRG